MRRRTLLILMSLLALAVVAPAAALAKADRPLKGRGSGTTTFDFGIVPIPGTAEGTARFSHLGKSTYSSEYTITFSSATAFTIAGTQTIVAANGDMLFATFTGTGNLDGPFGAGQSAENTLVSTISGGTGRFADASGTVTTTFFSAAFSVIGTTATSNQSLTARGRISY
jgi:hypothetical protein